MANQTSNPVPVRQSRKSNFKHNLIVAEQVVLGILIVGAVGFYAGVQYQVRKEANTKAAIQDAVQAATAPAVATAPKN